MFFVWKIIPENVREKMERNIGKDCNFLWVPLDFKGILVYNEICESMYLFGANSISLHYGRTLFAGALRERKTRRTHH